MRVSEYFSLNRKQNELDFVDIDFNNDTPLFIDPYFLSIRTDRWSQSANSTLESFFQYILVLFKNENIKEAKSNFIFTEPYETCLGLSKQGVKGKSIGDEDATILFKYILDSGVLDDELITNVNEIKIFVDNISHDKISDLTTNVIRKHLIDYTKQQCELYDIPLQKQVATNKYWDTDSLEWTSSYEEMLVIDERPILLVPKSIVCRTVGYHYESSKYTRHYVLNFLSNEELRLNTSLVKRKTIKSGEVKRNVVKQDVAEKYNAYSKEFLRSFTKKHPEYFELFKTDTKKKLTSLSNEEIMENYTENLYLNIIDRLIYEFSTIDIGRKDANKFHDHIIACMNFIFYPQLTHPTKEQEINQGRKRIDLSYNNSAKGGYFFNLAYVKDIPSAYIFVECKNYSKDVSNPELDQLNGRFSANRSKVGFMIFRNCKDESILLQRCIDYYRDNKNLILPMQDKDFINILANLKDKQYSDESSPQEEFLHKLTQKIIMG